MCAAAVLVSAAAFAQNPPAGPDCAAQATEKKLRGAALTSFMRKCDRDAAASACDAAAAEKKLAGAARTSFTKKCVRDAAAKPSVH
ncbi:PsiF family protein [Methylocystis sp. SC2]|uniref:PsiF family protein n=1 Tax=Methylocystis sp. (strain SC2) TaxID=187303 RepID=UPI00352749C2